MTTEYDTKIDWDFIRAEEGNWSIGYVPNIKNPVNGKIQSGVTVLFGFDLGQHDLKELDTLRLSPELKTKLSPYLKVRGPDAVMAEQRKFELSLDLLLAINAQQAGAPASSVGHIPSVGVSNAPDRPVKHGAKPSQFIAPTTALGLMLSKEECSELSDAIQRNYYSSISRAYAAAPAKRRFGELPVGVQTALLSLNWHTGAIWRKTHPAFQVFAAAAREDWADAVDSLTGSPIFWLPKYANFKERRIKEATLVRTAMGTPATLGPKSEKYLRQTVSDAVTTLGKLNK